MKKLILILFVLIGFLAEAQVSRIYTVDKTIVDSKAYRKRVTADAGSIRTDNIEKAFRAMAIQNEIYNNIQFAWFGESGYKHRVASATASFWSKLYSSKGTNDATQTTELNQPYLSGNIAPNERFALNNPNGSSKFITHPTISFAANEAWSVTTVINANNTNQLNVTPYGNGSDAESIIFLKVDNINRLRIRNANGVNVTGSVYTTNSIYGKNSIVTLVADGNGSVKFYINGVYIETISIASNINFSSLLRGYSNTIYAFNGKLYAHIIRSGVLTQSQITSEYNFFRSIYPEIETVKIGSQDWATSNLDMVSTPMGNLIANVTDNAAWANSTNIYNATSGTEYDKVKAAAMWCYYNNDAALGAIYGKLYNWYAAKLLQMDIDYYNAANPSTPWGYRVPTSADFTTLQTTLGGSAVAGGKMKKEGLLYWNSPNTGADNSSGFSALGGASRHVTTGVSSGLGGSCGFWTTTISSATSSIRIACFNTDASVSTLAILNGYGISIRLIKN